MNNSVISETHCYVTKIILNKPEEGNVVNNDNLPLISKYIEDANLSDETRIIVIEGRDGKFSRGMDFKNLIKNSDSEITSDFHNPYKDAVLAIRNSKKPVIAKVEGDVLAGGMGLAFACDIIIASKSSTFGLSEVLFGIIPAYVFPLLLERIPFKKARYLILSSKRLNAEEAFNYGIIDEVVEDDKIEKCLKDYLKRLLYSSPEALKITKEYTDKFQSKDIEEGLDIAQKQLTELLNNKNNINAISNFLEGEKPEWAISYKSKK